MHLFQGGHKKRNQFPSECSPVNCEPSRWFAWQRERLRVVREDDENREVY